MCYNQWKLWKSCKHSKPTDAGSNYHDYKGNKIIRAVAAVGHELEIISADPGTYGRIPDSSNWTDNAFQQAIAYPDNPINIPPPKPLTGRNTQIPYVITGDDAFALNLSS